MRCVFAILCLLFAMPLRAVIVSGGDGSGNTTAVGAGEGWNYVGSVNGASGVFLGDYGGSYWVLTAAHVGAGAFTLDGATYQQLGSAYSLTSESGAAVDLVLFRIDGGPALSPLTLSAATPTLDERVTMIGNGVNRGTDETFWSASWQENPSFGIHKGYKWTGSVAKRWGTNTVSNTNLVEGATTYFATTFERPAGSAQAAVGDSGGGVFVVRNGAVELAGIMGLVSTVTGQPEATSLYGGLTYSADISVYRSQILDIVNSATPVPEPGVFSLLLLAGLGGALAWRLRR